MHVDQKNLYAYIFAGIDLLSDDKLRETGYTH